MSKRSAKRGKTNRDIRRAAFEALSVPARQGRQRPGSENPHKSVGGKGSNRKRRSK